MKMLLGKLSLVVVAAASAVGCAGMIPKAKFDDLARQREDLERQNVQLQGELAASEARAKALEKELAGKRDIALPPGLKGKIGIRKQGGDTILDLPSDVFFPSGSAELSKKGEGTLAEVATLVKKNGTGAMVRVEGHADSDPINRTKSKYHCNWELSFERAHAVLHCLIEKGMDPRSLACDCYGEYQPQDAKDKAKNRRVEIVISR